MTAAHRFSNALRYRDESDPRQVQLTPDYILDPVRDMFGGTIDLDPCTLPDNPTRATRFYHPPMDGAALPWDAERIFVNPPYGKARERWVRRCVDAAYAGSEVVLLIPAHPDTALFHEALETARFVVFIRGRVKFGVLRPNRRQAAASHPSALIVWGIDDPEPLRHLGTYVVPAWASMLSVRASTPSAQDEGPYLEVDGVLHSVTCAAYGAAYGGTGHCSCSPHSKGTQERRASAQDETPTKEGSTATAE